MGDVAAHCTHFTGESNEGGASPPSGRLRQFGVTSGETRNEIGANPLGPSTLRAIPPSFPSLAAMI